MNNFSFTMPILRQLVLAATLVLVTHTRLLDATTLIENSPFIPPVQEPVAQKSDIPNPELQNLAFKGVYSIGTKRYFNIFNKQENKSVWIAQGDPSAAYTVVDFDETNTTIRLKSGGTEQNFSLEHPSWVSTPVAMAAVQPMPQIIPPGVGKYGNPAMGTATPGLPQSSKFDMPDNIGLAGVRGSVVTAVRVGSNGAGSSTQPVRRPLNPNASFIPGMTMTPEQHEAARLHLGYTSTTGQQAPSNP